MIALQAIQHMATLHARQHMIALKARQHMPTLQARQHMICVICLGFSSVMFCHRRKSAGEGR